MKWKFKVFKQTKYKHHKMLLEYFSKSTQYIPPLVCVLCVQTSMLFLWCVVMVMSDLLPVLLMSEQITSSSYVTLSMSTHALFTGYFIAMQDSDLLLHCGTSCSQTNDSTFNWNTAASNQRSSRMWPGWSEIQYTPASYITTQDSCFL